MLSDKIKEYKKKYYASHPWAKHFNYILARCGDKTSKYHKKGIKNYLHTWDLEFLWKRDKAYLLQKPSIDRIDGSGDYTLSNCRFIEWIENCNRGDIPAPSIMVSCFTSNGEEIKFKSINSASRWLGKGFWTVHNILKYHNGLYNGMRFIADRKNSSYKRKDRNGYTRKKVDR